MELELAFGVLDGDSLDRNGGGDLSAVPGITGNEDAFNEIARDVDPAASVAVRPGSIGKGASGSGVVLALQIAEEVMNDGASLLALSAALWAFVHRVRGSSQRGLSVQDPTTIGVLAAGADPGFRDRIVGAHRGRPVSLTGGDLGLGTDSRDIWVVPFVQASGDVWVIFTSCDGVILGEVSVPARWTPDGGLRSPEEILAWFSRLNRSDPRSD
jgi:hypothetical protein